MVMLCFCKYENDGSQDPACSTLCPSNLHSDKGSAPYREVRMFVTMTEVLVISDSDDVDDSDDGDDGDADVDHGDHLTRYRE